MRNMQKVTNNPQIQQGVTLVELMVAMAISLIVLLAVGTVYTTTKRTYSVQDDFSRMQENALFAFQTMTQDISTAGFAGCSPQINNLLNTTAANSGLFNYVDGVYGWDYKNTDPGDTYTINSLATTVTASNWSDNSGLGLHTSLSQKVVPGTDVLVMKSGRELTTLVPTADIKPADIKVQFAGPTLMPQGAVILLSDCNKADLFMNSDAIGDSTLARDTTCGSAKPCNSGAPWSHVYKSAEVRVLASTSRAYYIGIGTNGEPSLFRYNYDQGDTGASPEELVTGVENMQILYGESLNGEPFKPTRYIPFNSVTNPANIVSVRISLLMRSSGEANRPSVASPTFLVGGTTAATAVSVNNSVPDRRMRKVFTTTIALRNMAVTGR
ncbi:MAG: prepilin-type N-terminal cleavage/methylation domain-containing protein [Gammaproteobacteria bacterium]|nr:prepilin-type N-terminal cleavage/methylation domain-containing protein [Gammaproteobacteria bacterium]